jgi:hypothetical protein
VNWRTIIAWSLLSLAAWFLLVGISGLLASTVIQEAYDLRDIPLGQAGVLVPVVISIGLLPRLAVGFLLATSIWALLARGLPKLENRITSYVLGITLYSLLIGILAWLALPLNEPFAIYGAVVFVTSFHLPRMVTSKLSRGMFAA